MAAPQIVDLVVRQLAQQVRKGAESRMSGKPHKKKACNICPRVKDKARAGGAHPEGVPQCPWCGEGWGSS